MIKSKVQLQVNGRNAEYLRQNGYDVPKSFKRGFSLEVDIKHLSKGSKARITRICDSCGQVDEVPFRDLGSEVLCRLCSLKSQTGVKNPFYGKTHSKDTIRKIKEKQPPDLVKKMNKIRKENFAKKSGYSSREEMERTVIEFLEKHMCGASSPLLKELNVSKIQAETILKSNNRLDLINESKEFRQKRLREHHLNQRERESQNRGYRSYSEMEKTVVEYIEINKVAPYSEEAKVRFPNLCSTTLGKILVRAGREDLISNFTSSGENELVSFIESIYSGETFKNNRSVLDGKEIDVLLPELNIGFEFNGLYWHSEIIKDKKYHFEKRVIAESKGVRLIQINSDEWILKNDVVKSMIRNILGITENKLDARKCEIRKVSKREAEVFLEENHLMGSIIVGSHYGLYHQNQLVSLMSVCKKGKGLDIARFCTLKYTVVRGAFSRLLKEVEKGNYEFIQSFVDERYANGNSLIQSGFVKMKTTLGWKWTNGKRTFNRLTCRADSKNEITEKEAAKKKGLFKIYDAGQTKWIKNLN